MSDDHEPGEHLFQGTPGDGRDHPCLFCGTNDDDALMGVSCVPYDEQVKQVKTTARHLGMTVKA